MTIYDTNVFPRASVVIYRESVSNKPQLFEDVRHSIIPDTDIAVSVFVKYPFEPFFEIIFFFTFFQ